MGTMAEREVARERPELPGGSLEASRTLRVARLADVSGRDIESAFVGWAEPAL